MLFIILIFFALSFKSHVYASSTDISEYKDFWISISPYYYEYTGKEIKPNIKIYITANNQPLKKGTDYTISYKNNINVGYGQAIINGKGKYTGTRTATFQIVKYNIENATIDTISDQTYTGGLIQPKVKNVKYKGKTLIEGTDYTVTYSRPTNNITSIGINYIYINGKGDFGGFRNIPFNVVPPKITNVKANLQADGINISWKQTSIDVDGYEIYRKAPGAKEYTFLATVDNNTTTFLDKTANKVGKTYKYKVHSYKTVNYSKIIGKNSSASSVIFVPKITYTLTSYNDKTYLKWNKIKGASGYEIYRSTSKNSGFTKIKNRSSSKNTYTDSAIKSFTTYYYKIRAYISTSSGKVYGPYSDTMKKTPLAKVKIKDTKKNGNNIKLTWNKVSNIKGYRIYRKTANSSYKKIATLSSKKTSYTDKNIKQGYAYTYKIRVYKTKNKKELLGDYSDEKFVATGSRTQQINKIKLQPDKEFKNSGWKSYYKDYEKLIKKYTNSKMSTYTKVKTMYKYLTNHLYHKDGYHCKNFAATFASICRVIGLDAYCASGETKSGNGYTAHTWTIVNINGTEYIFDASLERHNSDRKKNKKSIDYRYFFKTYKELNKVYKFQGYDNFFPFFMVPGNNLK